MVKRLAIMLLGLALVQSAQAQKATIRQVERVFRTYGYGDPDPVVRMGPIYPYFRFDGFTAVPTDQSWRVVILENPYIRVLVSPEQGGKILGAFERSTGRDFIYFNPVVKFRDVAMRGPWTSGGIEFNFGAIGHAPTTASPVDCLCRENGDGSVSCIVGALDLPSRSRWQVEIRLPADKAWFETRSTWTNPTPNRSSLYHWMNGAVAAAPNLRYAYPGTAYVGHDGEALAWPVDSTGRDLSRYGNNDFGSYKSYHVLGGRDDLFGGWYEGEGFGFGHWSPPGSKPGKKIWIWGLSRQGMIWEDLLTDTDLGGRQYSEIQSGLLYNQAGAGSSRTPFKHRFLEPGAAHRFREIWFPILGLEGLDDANERGVLALADAPQGKVVGVMALAELGDTLRVWEGEELILSAPIKLAPTAVWRDTLQCDGPMTVELKQSGLRVVQPALETSSPQWERPLTTPPDFDSTTPQALYVQALERARQRDWPGALQKAEACLEKDFCHGPALSLAAEAQLWRLDPEQAFSLSGKALALDAYDPHANWVYGQAAWQLGRTVEALRALEWAAQSPQWRMPALAQAAEIRGAYEEWDEVAELAEAMLERDSQHIQGLELLATAQRVLGRSADHEATLKRLAQADPLSARVPLERCLMHGGENRLERFRNSVGGELPHETFLELAIAYVRLGRLADAWTVLCAATHHPMVRVWRAYLAHRLGKEEGSQAEVHQAVIASPRGLFPHRPESLEPLYWALVQRDSWKFRYAIALVLWRHDRLKEAADYLRSCGNTPDDAPFYLTRARLLEADDERAALKDRSRALRLDPENWRCHAALLDHYLTRGRIRDALPLAQTASRRFSEDYRIQLRCAKTLLLAGRPADAAGILSDLTILPYEGAQEGRRVYREAHLRLALAHLSAGSPDSALASIALARQWPERLGVGRPYDPDEGLEDLLEAEALSRSGQRDAAAALWQGIVQRPDVADSRAALIALALKRLGRSQEIPDRLKAWAVATPNDAAWALAWFVDGNRSSGVPPSAGEGRIAPWEGAAADPDARLIHDIVTQLDRKE